MSDILFASKAFLKRVSCATALYYYDSENISKSLLALRQQVEDDSQLYYKQNLYQALETIYGFENEGPCIQNLGDIFTKAIFSFFSRRRLVLITC